MLSDTKAIIYNKQATSLGHTFRSGVDRSTTSPNTWFLHTKPWISLCSAEIWFGNHPSLLIQYIQAWPSTVLLAETMFPMYPSVLGWEQHTYEYTDGTYRVLSDMNGYLTIVKQCKFNSWLLELNSKFCISYFDILLAPLKRNGKFIALECQKINAGSFIILLSCMAKSPTWLTGDQKETERIIILLQT